VSAFVAGGAVGAVVAALDAPATLGTTSVAPAVATIAPNIRLDLRERRGVVISLTPWGHAGESFTGHASE